jgi:hypothetical protein
MSSKFEETMAKLMTRDKSTIDSMKAKLVYNCPLSPYPRMCHPSCNWWNSIWCTYPVKNQRKELKRVKVGAAKSG